MKKYEQPSVEVYTFEVEDFIAISSEHDNIFGDIADLFRRK